jgi:hypothetical protein
MTVKHEIKSQLAKLLATEDLVVEHKKVSTASFDVLNRVLTLPMWERASSTVYDMLVGHEVGHALFTPSDEWDFKIPMQFINVVEDARIEKLMKRKYLGIGKSFYRGYKELNEQDFFDIANEDISKFNLADRANLLFKIGNFVDVLIEQGEEEEIIDLIANTETFADVLIAAEELYKYCKKEKKDKEESPAEQNPEGNTQSDEGSQSSESQPQGQSEGGEKSTEQESTEGEEQETESSEPEVKTAESLDDKLKKLVNNNPYDTTYVEIPQVNLDTIIGKNVEIHKEIDSFFARQQEQIDEQNKENNWQTVNLYANADVDFRKFKVSAQKEVNYLVKEFECKKAADSYARATTARTGVLDCTKLHSYKYNEDLFKKVTTLADGKNHGLVFVLDWSGSMAGVMSDTIKQLYNLIWFCKKVAIPFDVYAFTNEWRRGGYDYQTKQHIPVDTTPHYEKKNGLLCVDPTFSMMNILTSKVSGKELEHQMLNIWRVVYSFARYSCGYTHPNRLGLSGTPLNEAFITLHQILPKFQKDNKLQKVQCIVLTDGEANYLPHHVTFQRYGEPCIGTKNTYTNTSVLRDRKLGTTYKFGDGWNAFSDTMLRHLKDTFPSVNFIGIRVVESRNVSSFIKIYHNQYSDEYSKIQQDWKKLGSFAIKGSGYDIYFGLSSSKLSQEVEFEVKEDATKTQIKSAFVKSLKTKKLNKKVLSQFIELVA